MWTVRTKTPKGVQSGDAELWRAASVRREEYEVSNTSYSVWEYCISEAWRSMHPHKCDDQAQVSGAGEVPRGIHDAQVPGAGVFPGGTHEMPPNQGEEVQGSAPTTPINRFARSTDLDDDLDDKSDHRLGANPRSWDQVREDGRDQGREEVERYAACTRSRSCSLSHRWRRNDAEPTQEERTLTMAFFKSFSWSSAARFIKPRVPYSEVFVGIEKGRGNAGAR